MDDQIRPADSSGARKSRLVTQSCFLIICIAVCLLLCTTPLVLMSIPQSVDRLSPAYQLKIASPLADTATIPPSAYKNRGPWSHGAKLTPRVLPAVFIKFSVWLGLSFAWPATIGGIALIGAVIFYVYQTTDDLLTCFYAGLCMAGNQVCSNCFSLLFEFKPFDGVALGLVGLTLAASCVSPIATGLLAFCSLWSDERSLISLMLIATFVSIGKPAGASRSNRLLFSMGLALVGYIISRPMISWLAGWGSQDLSMLGTSVLSATLPFSGLVPWLSLEGAVILVIAVFRELSSRQEWYRSVVLAAALALAWASCLVVLDISRACCFLFVVIPLSIYLLSTFSVSRQELRRLTLYSAAISILAPNIYVIAGVVLNIIPSWAMRLLNT